MKRMAYIPFHKRMGLGFLSVSKLLIIERLFQNNPSGTTNVVPTFGPGRKHSFSPLWLKICHRHIFLTRRVLIRGRLFALSSFQFIPQIEHHLICLRVGEYACRRAQMRQSFI